MYGRGLVRFASEKYDPTAAGGGKRTQFLTNTSVNKKNGTSSGKHAAAAGSSSSGNKVRGLARASLLSRHLYLKVGA